jgi:hypothetical protein
MVANNRMINELKILWTEAVVDYFKVLYRKSPGDTEKNDETSQDSRCPGRTSNWAPSEQKSEVLTSDPVFLASSPFPHMFYVMI